MRFRPANSLLGLLLALTALCLAPVVASQRARAQPPDEQAPSERLLERAPFDRITLDAANKDAELDVQLLEFPDRRPPAPFPESGTLEVRLIDQPSVAYELQWSAVERIDLFEHLLLQEARRLTEAGQFAEAFEYFSYLHRYYAQLPGLEAAFQQHLWRDAIDAFNRNEPESALPALTSLYGRNPNFPRLANAVQSVSESLLTDRWESGDVAGARHVVDVIAAAFGQLELPQIAQWRDRFRSDAQQQLDRARQAIAAKQFNEARRAVQRALAILPEIRGAEELLLEIHRASPEIRVAVFSTDESIRPGAALDRQSARLARLLRPRLFEQVGFGAEGGLYRSQWVEQSASDDGLRSTLRFTPDAVQRGLLPERLALAVLATADADDVDSASLAAALDHIDLVDGDAVQLTWHRPHVRPESLLQLPLARLAPAGGAGAAWTAAPAEDGKSTQFSPGAVEGAQAAGDDRRLDVTIVEELYDNDDAAVEALLDGEVDLLETAPPWQVERLRAARGVRVGRYRLPTVHVLAPSATSPLLEIREFRRAICYAIDREAVVRDLILAGDPQPGFRALSGPVPAGDSLNDPVGYAYASDIAPRPYEPRLAKVLVSVARAALQKRQKAEQGDASDGTDDLQRQSTTPAGEETLATAEPSPETLPPLEPLVLAHPSDPVAQLACRTIKLQLEQVGIPVKLLQLTGTQPEAGQDFDLLYAELAPTEPLVDARRMLGAGGLAPHTSAIMNVHLDALDRAANWNEVQQRAREVHRAAHDELYLIPLWQTVRFFAYRDWLEGVGDEPISIYQDVDAWRKRFGEAAP